MAERLTELESLKVVGNESLVERGDLLAKFLKAQKEHRDFFDDSRVLTMTTSIALAGSDTTAISLAAVFYHLLRSAECYRRLNEEIEEAVRSGLIEDSEIVSWNEGQKLPYLDACIKEAFRIHPAIGFNLERVTPPQGLNICGTLIPGGTIVSCNPWIIHRRPEVFGEDTEAYRPERWLIDPNAAPEVEQQRIKLMATTLFQFGGGSRTCLGKHIALLEMYKLIPSFLRRFDVSYTMLAKAHESPGILV